MGQVKNKVKNRNYAGQGIVTPESMEREYTDTRLPSVDYLYARLGREPSLILFPTRITQYVFYAFTNLGRLYWRYQSNVYEENSADDDVRRYVAAMGEVIVHSGRCIDPILLRGVGVPAHIMGDRPLDYQGDIS